MKYKVHTFTRHYNSDLNCHYRTKSAVLVLESYNGTITKAPDCWKWMLNKPISMMVDKCKEMGFNWSVEP